jgi:hypothetical protein
VSDAKITAEERARLRDDYGTCRAPVYDSNGFGCTMCATTRPCADHPAGAEAAVIRLLAALDASEAEVAGLRAPIPMLMYCPRCGVQHVDKPSDDGSWTNPPHYTHTCQSCGARWRWCDSHPTTGVGSISDPGRDVVDPAPHAQRDRIAALEAELASAKAEANGFREYIDSGVCSNEAVVTEVAEATQRLRADLARVTAERDEQTADATAAHRLLNERTREADALVTERDTLKRERDALHAKLNTPQVAEFTSAVMAEAAHQRDRWGSEHDAGKEPTDWFWLVGYLAGKAIRPGEEDKRAHRIIATAAALANWFLAEIGADTSMRPGIEPPEDAARKEAGLT